MNVNSLASRVVTLVGIGGVLALAALPARAQTFDPDDVAAGMRIFQQKANCQACHGWAGDGNKTDSQMPDGANLRETKLDRQGLMQVIKCGIPQTGMPPFDPQAYSDGRCYGLKQADLKARGIDMGDPPATLGPSEIDSLVTFLQAKVIGKGPMDHANCVQFWGKDVEACDELDNN